MIDFQKIKFYNHNIQILLIKVSMEYHFPVSSSDNIIYNLVASVNAEDAMDSESSSSDSVESEDSIEEVTTNSPSRAPDEGQHTSTTYIEIIHHPSSGLEPEFIFQGLPSLTQATNHQAAHQSKRVPWAPFRTRADFEFAEIVTQSALSSSTIKKLLKGIRHSWTDPGHSRITFENFKDFKQCMEASRKYVVQVSSILFINIMMCN